MLRQWTILAVLAALAAPTVLSDPGDTAPNVVTTCAGGQTRTTNVYAIDDDMRLHADTDGWYYLYYHPYRSGVWEETNNRPGLQVDPLVCTERDISTWQVVNVYVSVHPDIPVVEGHNLE